MKKHIFAFAAAGLFSASAAQAQNITLTMTAAVAGSSSDVAAKHLAEVASVKGIATIQVQSGQTLTKTAQQVAEGKTDISATPFILRFLMSRGLGPYVGLGKQKGKELADNLRILYAYNLSQFYLVAYQSTGIDSWKKNSWKDDFQRPAAWWRTGDRAPDRADNHRNDRWQGIHGQAGCLGPS